jgi:hypothetical protein
VVNQQDLDTLLDEAEKRAAIDCDYSECLLAVANSIGAEN